MTQTQAFAVRIEAEHAGDGPEVIRAGMFCFAMSAVILVAGVLWLGWGGMFDLGSPDFFPLPDFFAVAATALGVFFVFRGALHLRRFRKFGTSVFESNAPVLGETLIGRLRTVNDVQARGPFTLRLRCDRRYSSSGPGSDTRSRRRTEHLWESVRTVPAETHSSIGIPVAFELPEDGLPTGRRPKPKTGVHPEDRDRILWTLHVSAPLPGLDYVAEFPLEVGAGKLMRALAEHAGAAPRDTTTAHPGPRTKAQRAGLAVLDVASVVLGGHVPTDAENAADARADAVVEPAIPFQGQRKPEQEGTKWARVVALGAGVILSAMGTYALVLQLSYGRRADHLTGVVQTVEKNRLTLVLDGDGAAAHSYVSGMRHWQVGQKVALACAPEAAEPRRCRADTGLDRWLDGVGTLAIGLGALGGGVYLQRRRVG